MEQKVFSCILREPQMSASNTGPQGGRCPQVTPGFYGNAEANYSVANFTVNSCSVTIKPLTVPCFFWPGFSRTTAEFERAGKGGGWVVKWFAPSPPHNG